MELKILNYNNIPIYYASKSRNLPIVVVLHGFTSNSYRQEARTGIIKKLYENNFCVVAFDSVRHGNREGAEEFLQKEIKEQEEMLFDIVVESAMEMDGILKFIKSSGVGDEKRVGITGISMGGFIIFKTAELTDEVRYLAPMVASPYFEEFAKYALKKNGIENFEEYEERFKILREQEPLKNKKCILSKNIFIMAGKFDHTVPEEFSKKGYEELKKLYLINGIAQNIKYKSYPAQHCENEEMIRDMIKWFKKVL